MDSDIRTIYRRLYDAWDADTSYCEDYNEVGIKSYGQCAVTSLLLQERYGGRFYSGIVCYDGEETVHYWLVSDGYKIDLTWDQFPSWAVLKCVQSVSRRVLLPPDNKWMQNKYKTLSDRVLGTNEYIQQAS